MRTSIVRTRLTACAARATHGAQVVLMAGMEKIFNSMLAPGGTELHLWSASECAKGLEVAVHDTPIPPCPPPTHSSPVCIPPPAHPVTPTSQLSRRTRFFG